MITLIRLLFKPWGLVILGALIIGGGGMFVVFSQMGVPERAALRQVAGVLDSATKVTRGRMHQVSYDLGIKSASGEVVKLTLQDHQISEGQVKNLLGRPVVALFGGFGDGKDVWELSAGGTTIIRYEQTRQKHIEFQAFSAKAAPVLGAGGLAVSLMGVLWLRRRRRVAIAA